MHRLWIIAVEPSRLLRNLLAVAAAAGMDRYWGSFARTAASGRSAIVTSGDMA